MPPQNLIPELLDTIASIPSEEHRRRALRGAAALFDADRRPAALELARRLQDPFCRAQALTAIAAHMPDDDPERPAALNAALAAIRLAPDAEQRAVVLAPLAMLAYDQPGLDALAIARAALESIAATAPNEEHARWLAALPPDLDAETVEHISALPEPWLQALAWAELAGCRPAIGGEPGPHPAPTFIPGPEALLRAAIAYQQIEPLPQRLLAASTLLAQLPAEDRDDLLRELILECCESTGSNHTAAIRVKPAVDTVAAYQLLDGGLEYLPDDLLPHALALGRAVAEPARRMDVFARLAARLPAAERLDLAGEALSYLAGVGDEFGLAGGLANLARFFPPERLDELIALAMRITDGWARADALSALARAAGKDAPQRPTLLADALAAARAEISPWKRARALTIVIGRGL